MDLDTIISLVILLAFFVLPQMMKMVMGRQKKNPPASEEKEKKPGVVEKIFLRVQEYIEEIEAAAKKEAPSGGEGTDFWEAIHDESARGEEYETDRADDTLTQMEAPLTEPGPVPPQRAAPPDLRPEIRKKKQSRCRQTTKRGYGLGGGRRTPLQNAVIWSEILGPPRAMKDNSRR